MKRSWKSVLTILCAICLVVGSAAAESVVVIGSDDQHSIKFDEWNSIENIVDFKIGTPTVVDQLGVSGEASGDKYEFLIVPVTLLNTGFESITFGKMIKAIVAYKDKYIFEQLNGTGADLAQSDISGKWVGKYTNGDSGFGCDLLITEGDSGEVVVDSFWYSNDLGKYKAGNVTYTPENPYITEGMDGKYNEEKGTLSFGHWSGTFDEKGMLICKNKVATAMLVLEKAADKSFDINMPLDMLVEDSQNYIFKIPNIVASATEARELKITVSDTDYVVSF